MPNNAQELERRKIIGELRACRESLLERLPLNGDAMIVGSSGVVAMNETYTYASTVISMRADIDDRFIRCAYGLSHEAVHMVQLVSTHFPLEMALEFANICALTNKRLKSETPEAEWVSGVVRDYRIAIYRMEHHEARFSALDVIEAQAVIEGFRGAFSKYSENSLANLIAIAHGLESDYADVIGTLLAAYGFTFTFEVVPKLCWLALQTKEPGVTFTSWLMKLSEVDVSPLTKMSACELCVAFGTDPEKASRSIRAKIPGVRKHPLHALFSGYFDVVESETDPEAFLQLVMHPGRSSAPTAKIRMTDMMPPLTIFTDDRYLMHGPYKNQDWDAAEPLLRAATLATETLDWIGEQSDRLPR
jgi:hypothetical protein